MVKSIELIEWISRSQLFLLNWSISKPRNFALGINEYLAQCNCARGCKEGLCCARVVIKLYLLIDKLGINHY